MSEVVEEKTEKVLNGKQKLFADFYIGEARQNATKAAILAGYSEKSARQMGSENLSKPYIFDYIETRQKELTLSAITVLNRLTDIANGQIDDLTDESGHFNFKLAKERGKTHLIKKLKTKRTLKQTKTEVREDMRDFLADDEVEQIESDIEIIYEEVEFELYSAHEALRDLAKHHKLFTEKSEVEHSGSVGLKHSIDEQTIKDINAAYDS